ncbi:MAG: hypothetical protein PHI05_04130 [Bacilli bacterium]|nr:hypothetical protein [Bacilli bacterium]MDD4547909.1 hypothetical protein [Bacilli bacterium]
MFIDNFLDMSTTEKILIILTAVLFMAIVLGLIKFIKYKKNRLKYTNDFSNDNDQSEINLEEINPVLNNLEKPVETKEEPSKIEIDSVLEQMRSNLMNQEQDQVRTFEEEQEEKSIISYQELLRINNKIPKEEIKTEKKEEKVPYTPSEAVSKFRNSEFISPIYGRVDNDMEYPTIPKIRRAKLGEDEEIDVLEPEIEMITEEEIEPVVKVQEIEPTDELEKTIDTSKLKEEMLKNEKFLNALREFRKNLE